MQQPWLAVLMPTHNGAEYLRFALDSIAAQGDHAIECIAVDDDSTDSTLSILDDYAEKLPLTVLQRRKGNWAANTNFALEASQAEYVCFLHQDDIWLDHRLAILKNLVRRHPEAGLIFHPSRFIGPSGKRLGTWHSPFPPMCPTD